MKNNLITSFFVVATLVLIFGQISFAQDMKGKFGIGARVAYVNYASDGYDYLIYDIETDFDDAFMYGGNLTYFLHKYFSFELSVDHVETDVDLKISVPGDITRTVVGVGELEQLPILLTARTHFSTNPKVNPYFGVGIGYYLNDFNSNDLVRSALPPGGKLDPDDSFGFHISTGVEFFLNEHFAFNLEFKYIWNETDLKAKVPGELTEEIDFQLDTFVAGVGFKYYF